MFDATQRLLAMLRMRQLSLISTLADAGSMRAAGQRLHLSAAAVSKGLRDVEALFGVQIFHRLPHGVVTTAAGDQVVQRARVLLAEVAQLAGELAASGMPADACLRVGAPPFIAWTYLPRLLRSMEGEGRLPAVRVVEGRLADMCQKLEAGDLDVLITMSTPSELGGLKPDGFVLEAIDTEQWTIVCAPAHACAASGPYDWARLREEDWILPPRPTHARMMVEQLLLQHGLAPIAPRIESTNAITNLQLAEQGLGLTLVARCVSDDRLRRGVLVEVGAETLPPVVPIVMVYRLGDAHRGGVGALREAAQRVRRPSMPPEASASSSAMMFSARKSRP